MLNNDTINRFVFMGSGLLISALTALVLRSLSLYSLFRLDIHKLDPIASILDIGMRVSGLLPQLPSYQQLAAFIPMFAPLIKLRLCLGDYIELVGAYVLATLMGQL